ncbi:MAG TPA: hypothetical protein DCP10_04500 [Bacteroidales bacterium]|nr:hypothetical protein [Bacteroidales bacterium]
MNKFKTDWLASEPVFYNQLTKKISHNINDVIDFKNIEFHPEGLSNFLDFGYSVFGQTSLKHVKFLRHSSEIFIKNGKLNIIEHPDPVDEWFRKHPKYSDEDEVLDLIKKKIQLWESKTTGPIIIPTSGGFDSRLLNFFVKDKSRIRAFTYGISPKQPESYEVVYAKALCQKFDIKWNQIELGDQHRYFAVWDRLFGISTHAHGMYHIEFYHKILDQFPDLSGCNFLSGIIGDGWAGGIEFKSIDSANLSDLGYTHGLHADSSFSKFITSREILNSFFRNNQINHKNLQIVNVLRIKMILLSYLLKLPSHFGFKVWSPYLDMDIALGMLNLPPERRKNRQWQVDFFKRKGIYFEDKIAAPNKLNNLNHQALRKIPIEPLNTEYLLDIIDPEYIRDINKKLKEPTLLNRMIPAIFNLPLHPWLISKIMGGFKKVGIKDNILKSYYAYLTLKPIENVIKKSKHK